MPIHLHPPREGLEVVRLLHWSIREFENGSRFLVGFSREIRDGRVSAAIVELDVVTRSARTASGRIYQLVGLSGSNSEAEYVFDCVAEIIGGGSGWLDVTAKLIPDCRVRKPDDLEELSVDATARLLGVPRLIVTKLIADNVLPSRIDATGYRRIRRIPTAAVLVYREILRAKQDARMGQLVDASEHADDAENETSGSTRGLRARKKVGVRKLAR
ncbi:SANTA domain-containing protein [Paraburkholderia tropica]|uniref:hypothetical protein n=1 Tax=Paraburkholderia tropica TaxID=92647 RepID=UPI002AB686F9|nr:hypothetical protein [Paraburkholderia tropica]